MLETQLLDIMAVVFDVPRNTLDEETNVENCENWDSMNHMNLILAIEEELHVKIPDDEAVDLISFGDLYAYLKNKVK